MLRDDVKLGQNMGHGNGVNVSLFTYMSIKQIVFLYIGPTFTQLTAQLKYLSKSSDWLEKPIRTLIGWKSRPSQKRTLFWTCNLLTGLQKLTLQYR